MNKYVQKMWRIYDVLFFDKEKAIALEDKMDIAKVVYVGITEDGILLDRNGISADYFGSWVFSNEEDALKEVKEFNAA